MPHKAKEFDVKRGLVALSSCVLVLVGVMCAQYLYGQFQDMQSRASMRLEVVGAELQLAKTHAPVHLKGAVSDFFRYSTSRLPYSLQSPHTLEHELRLVSALHDAGANTIGLYLSDFQKIQEHADDLDAYIEFAEERGMYVYLMPVARNFAESYSPVWYAPQPTDTHDLSGLIEFLAKRYQGKENILYGFGAEPEMPLEDFEEWYDTEVRLATMVRKYQTHAVLIVTGVDRFNIGPFAAKPFPFTNYLFETGGYVSESDAEYRSLKKKPDLLEKRYADVVSAYGMAETAPILLGEFGGNFLANFSSDIDLAAFKRLLDTALEKKYHIMAYRLGAHVEGDGLSLFDMEGKLTAKGKLYMEVLAKLLEKP